MNILRFSRIAIVLLLVILPFQNCGGGGGGGNVPGASGSTSEIWIATLTGTGKPAACDTGTFNHSYSFAVVFDGSLSQAIGRSMAEHTSITVRGSGGISGSETVATQSAYPGICVLQPSSAANVPFSFEAYYTEGYGTPVIEMFLRAEGSSSIIGCNTHFPYTNLYTRVPADKLGFSGVNFASTTEITGTWATVGYGSASNGNNAKGSFSMRLMGSAELIPGPIGVNVAPQINKVRMTWLPLQGAIGYKIIYAKGAPQPATPGYTVINNIPVDANTGYEISGLDANQPYTFVVIGLLPGGYETLVSTAVTATPIAPPPPMEILVIEKIATGHDHTCAIINGGEVRCWGQNNIGANVPGITTAYDIAAGNSFSCAVVGSGTVKCWGRGTSGELGNGQSVDSATPVDVSGISTAQSISARGSHACVRLGSPVGAVRCWGLGTSGQLGNGSLESSNIPVIAGGFVNDPINERYPAARVTVGEAHSCAVLTIGTVKCWGNTNNGEIGASAPYCQVGEICDPKAPNPSPTTVTSLSGVIDIAAGGAHTCAVISGGTVRCWGRGSHGQLGNNNNLHSNVIVAVSGLTGATNISSGDKFSCAALSNGTMKCWGNNDVGQLGNGTGLASAVPVVATGITNFVKSSITGGLKKTCMRLNDNTAFCF